MGCIEDKHNYYKDEKTGVEYSSRIPFSDHRINGIGKVVGPKGWTLEGKFDSWDGVMTKGTLTLEGKDTKEVEVNLTSYSYCRGGTIYGGRFIGTVGDYTGMFLAVRGPKYYGLVTKKYAVKDGKMYQGNKELQHNREICDEICESMNFQKVRGDDGTVKYKLREEGDTISWKGGNKGFVHGRREINYTDWGWEVLNTIVKWMNQN